MVFNKYIVIVGTALVISLMEVSTLISQDQDSRIKLTGNVLDAENKDPLAGVHLVTFDQGTTTDLDGNFTLMVSNADTVLISHVGYNDYLIPIPDQAQGEIRFTVALTPSQMELDEVYIYQWPATLSQFKQKVLATEVEDEEIVVIPGSHQGTPTPVAPGVGSPISFLQSKLSKKIRKRQEFLKKRLELERTQPARSRYNPEFVAEITGIEDEDELEEFMAYCVISDGYLTRVSDYDLIVTINQCYKNFQQAESQ